MKGLFVRGSLLTLRQANILIVILVLIAFYGVHNAWVEREQGYVKERQYAYQQTLLAHQLSAIDFVVRRLNGYVVYSADYPDQIEGVGVRGSWPLADWQRMLEQIQQNLWLTPEFVNWQRDLEHPNQWYGDIFWRIHRPDVLKPNHDWLPLSSDASPRTPVLLLSVVHDKRSAALLRVDGEEHWVSEGAWLPALSATIEGIQEQSILLRYGTGELKVLSIHGVTHPLWSKQQEG